jgi:hypothetical protein
LRRAADRLDPPDLHRRLGLRGLRRREPALLTSTAASLLQARLGLTDDELLAILDESPLTVIGGELEHRPELAILLALTEDHDAAILRRWLRSTGPDGRPLDLLLARDFARFEDALGTLAERGYVIRGRGGAPPATPRSDS